MYYCGWDGGGTKTEVCAVDETGRQIASRVFGPLNINGADEATVKRSVQECVAFMATLAGGLAACGNLVIGMAGVSNESAAALIRDTVRAAGYTGSLRLLGDQEIALAGAVRGPGAVLIAGTGAILFGRDGAGNPFRVGGYGYLIDDGGSGYAVGRDVLSAVVRAADGRSSPTCLTQMAFSQLGVQDIGGVITWLYAPSTGKKEVAALAPLLLPALEAGDSAAKEIAGKAAGDLSELVIAGWTKTGLRGGELAMTGSILTRFAPIRARAEALIHAFDPTIQIISPHGTAAQGAALLAMG